MSSGPSDAHREAEIESKIDYALALLEEAFAAGGWDPVFGVNAKLIRLSNERLRKYGCELRAVPR